MSYSALQSGYLQSFCEVMSEELEKIPGDSRTLIGFITYNSSVHFYNLSEDLSTPQIHIVSDVDGEYIHSYNFRGDGVHCPLLFSQSFEYKRTKHATSASTYIIDNVPFTVRGG